MNLIDETYFIGELSIANTDTVGVSENLTLFIKKYEKRFLEILLGASVYTDFIAGLALNPIPQKWQDLKAKLADSDTKESPIANYVYKFYKNNEALTAVGLGTAIPNAENATVVTPAYKITRAWNEMSDWVIDSRKWFNEFYLINGLTGYYYNAYYHYQYRREFSKINPLNI